MSRPSTDAEWTALGRYLAGESSGEEAAMVRRWLQEDPSLARFVKDLGATPRAWADRPPVDVEAALEKVRRRRDHPPVIDLTARRRRTIRLLQLAAALALVAGTSLIWRLVRTPGPPGDPVAHLTAVGRTDSVRLGDGTLAILGPSSRLLVLAGYGITGRAVELEGEAWFDVAPEGPGQFTVRAGAAEVVDLGTRFTVRTGAGEVRVMVESGSVRLQDTTRRAARSLTLRAGQAGTLAREAAPATAQPTERDLSWLRGRLVFDNAPLTRVREDLRRWYGLELIFADSALAGRHLSARFAGESPAEVLRVLELSLGATIERRGDSAIVRAGARR